jgi:hypothetical protein
VLIEVRERYYAVAVCRCLRQAATNASESAMAIKTMIRIRKGSNALTDGVEVDAWVCRYGPGMASKPRCLRERMIDVSVERGSEKSSGVVDAFGPPGVGDPPVAFGIDSQYCMIALCSSPPQPLRACAPDANTPMLIAAAMRSNALMHLPLPMRTAA